MEEPLRKFQRLFVLLISLPLWALGLSIYVAFVLPAFLLRFIVLRLFSPKGSAPVSIYPDPGFVFLGSSKRDTAHSVLLGYTLVEGDLGLQELRSRFMTNVIQARDPGTGEYIYPKYRQSIASVLGFRTWRSDPNFRIERHIRLLEGTEVREVTTEEELLGLLGPLSNRPFEAGSSPWEYLLVPNYLPKYSPGYRPRTLVVYRIHHGLCDGYSLVKCFVQHTCSDTLDKIMKPGQRSQAPGRPEFLKLGYSVLTIPGTFVKHIFTIDRNVWFLRKRNLSRECNIGMSRRLPVRLVKQVSKEQGVTFSTVLFAIVGGGIHKFFKRKYHGTRVRVPDTLQCLTPFPRPNHPDAQLVNHWAVGLIKILPNIPCSKQRLHENEVNLNEMKVSTFPMSSHFLLTILSAFPQPIIEFFATNFFSSGVLSNFPGPRQPVSYFGTFRVEDICFWAPHLSGSAGMGISMLSYVDYVRFGLNFDKAVLPDRRDLDELAVCIEEELKDLLRLSNTSSGPKSMEMTGVNGNAKANLRRRSVS